MKINVNEIITGEPAPESPKTPVNESIPLIEPPPALKKSQPHIAYPPASRKSAQLIEKTLAGTRLDRNLSNVTTGDEDHSHYMDIPETLTAHSIGLPSNPKNWFVPINFAEANNITRCHL